MPLRSSARTDYWAIEADGTEKFPFDPVKTNQKRGRYTLARIRYSRLSNRSRRCSLVSSVTRSSHRLARVDSFAGAVHPDAIDHMASFDHTASRDQAYFSLSFPLLRRISKEFFNSSSIS